MRDIKERPTNRTPRVSIRLEISSDHSTLQAEIDLLISALTNLFDNAKKAGAKEIRIFISEKEIYVADDGKGISEQELKKIAQPFYMLDSSRHAEGFGLGLSLVEKIAALHGRKLFIESTEGTGTKVTLAQ